MADDSVHGGNDGGPRSNHLIRVTVTKLSDLPHAGTSHFEPFVILSMGDQQAQSPNATPTLGGIVDEFDVSTSCAFPIPTSPDEIESPLLIQILDAEGGHGLVAKTALTKWRRLLKDGRRVLVVDLQPSGTVRIELRIVPAMVHTNIPDRLDILFGSLSRLPSHVTKPQIFARIGDVNISTTECKRVKQETSGYFEVGECHTCRYTGERLLDIQIRDLDENPIGISRFDLNELLLSTKHRRRIVGRLPITDPKGQVKGLLDIGLALWNSESILGANAHLEGAMQEARSRIKNARSLAHALGDPEVPSNQLDGAGEALDELDLNFHTLQSPNKSKSMLLRERRVMKKNFKGPGGVIESIVDAEDNLRIIALARVGEITDEGREIKQALERALQESSLGQRPSVNATLQELEDLITRANEELREMDSQRQQIQNIDSQFTLVMQESLAAVNAALKRMEALAVEGDNIAQHLSAMRKDGRLSNRLQNHILSQIVMEPHIVERPVNMGCFPCCH